MALGLDRRKARGLRTAALREKTNHRRFIREPVIPWRRP